MPGRRWWSCRTLGGGLYCGGDAGPGRQLGHGMPWRREAWAAAQAACGGYAGPGRQLDDDDLQSRFRASVSAILESGRLPRGAQMEALGKHFRAVHIVALR